jgi:hypothetical protein
MTCRIRNIPNNLYIYIALLIEKEQLQVKVNEMKTMTAELEEKYRMQEERSMMLLTENNHLVKKCHSLLREIQKSNLSNSLVQSFSGSAKGHGGSGTSNSDGMTDTGNTFNSSSSSSTSSNASMVYGTGSRTTGKSMNNISSGAVDLSDMMSVTAVKATTAHTAMIMESELVTQAGNQRQPAAVGVEMEERNDQCCDRQTYKDVIVTIAQLQEENYHLKYQLCQYASSTTTAAATAARDIHMGLVQQQQQPSQLHLTAGRGGAGMWALTDTMDSTSCFPAAAAAGIFTVNSVRLSSHSHTDGTQPPPAVSGAYTDRHTRGGMASTTSSASVATTHESHSDRESLDYTQQYLPTAADEFDMTAGCFNFQHYFLPAGSAPISAQRQQSSTITSTNNSTTKMIYNKSRKNY